MNGPIAIGDRVRWIHTGTKAGKPTMKIRTGNVVTIDCAMVTVSERPGKTVQIAMHRLQRLAGPEEPQASA